MTEDFQKIESKVKNIGDKYLLSFLLKKIDDHKIFIGKYYRILSQYQNNTELLLNNDNIQNFIRNFKELKSKLNLLLKGSGIIPDLKSFDEDYKGFLNETNNYLSNLPEEKIVFQSEERFTKADDDKQFIKTVKFFKRVFFSVYQVPVVSENFFRKILKKKLKPPRRWEQKLPFRNLCEIYLKNETSFSFFNLLIKVNQILSSTSLRLWKTFEELEEYFIFSLKMYETEDKFYKTAKYDFSTGKKEIFISIENSAEEIRDEFEKIVNSAVVKLGNSCEKAGTIELPSSRFSRDNLEKKHAEVNKKYSQVNNGWTNTSFALFEDWKLNLELYLLRNILLESYYSIQIRIKRNINEKIIPEFRMLLNRFEKIRIDFNRAGTDKNIIKKVLLEGELSVLYQLKSYSVPKISESILDQNITLLIDGLENITRNSVEEISDKRGIVKTDLYDKEIKSSEIDFVSPKEIIQFEGLPEFYDYLQKTKNQISNEIQSIQNDLNSLVEIFNFNIESVEAAFDVEQNEIDDIRFIAVEGVDRTLSSAYGTREKVENLNLTISDVLKRSVDDFNLDVTRLTRTEKVLEIKLRIAKAKAKQKTIAFKNDLTKKVKKILPSIIESVKILFDKSKEKFIALSRIVGYTEKPSSISTEISDFLAETQTAIDLLPFVYRRLFRVEPLEDERFFIPRPESEKKLKTAFANWQKERFAACAIVGEKGSGSTTFINFFLKNFKPNYKTSRFVLTENIYNTDTFMNFMGEVIGNKDVRSLQEIISHVNNSKEKQIIIIENLQHLYLRLVGGFNVLKMIFELISKTNKNTFWIMSSSLYAWNYLDKSVNISDQFGYVINLEELNEDQIREVIYKRHKVSGYNIYFEPKGNYLDKKSFQKLNINHKQEVLKKDFFYLLYKFSKSNLSLALLYWLRTTREVSGDTITIGMLDDIDYSFLNILNLNKILTLHFMLIHDGLSIDDHVKIFNNDKKESKLILITMMDDGLLIKKEEMFNINPFLYRQIVNVLNSKNFIH